MSVRPTCLHPVRVNVFFFIKKTWPQALKDTSMHQLPSLYFADSSVFMDDHILSAQHKSIMCESQWTLAHAIMRNLGLLVSCALLIIIHSSEITFNNFLLHVNRHKSKSHCWCLFHSCVCDAIVCCDLIFSSCSRSWIWDYWRERGQAAFAAFHGLCEERQRFLWRDINPSTVGPDSCPLHWVRTWGLDDDDDDVTVHFTDIVNVNIWGTLHVIIHHVDGSHTVRH